VPNYCQNSDCATVHYREYEPPKIRWRYSNEPWQEIEGDDYTVKQEQGKCIATYYVTLGVVFRGNYQQSHPLGQYYGRISSINWRKFADGSIDRRFVDIYGGTRLNPDANVIVGSYFPGKNLSWDSFTVVKIERADGLPDNCGDCQFKITKNGQTVHTETRAVCPEIQKIPFDLSDVEKQIEIKKLADLEQIEINNTDIPAECLNIYITGNTTQYQGQICSSPGCPPPKYDVICCGPCESCPDGSCAVTCGDRICCYDQNGIAVKTISKASFC
jgi:hypothetical protein